MFVKVIPLTELAAQQARIGPKVSGLIAASLFDLAEWFWEITIRLGALWAGGDGEDASTINDA
jgi:hypothetical protein